MSSSHRQKQDPNHINIIGESSSSLSPTEFYYDVKSNDISYNFFIFQYDISKFESYTYITSTSNQKYTAILYLSPEKTHLVLLVLKMIFDETRENIRYKSKASIRLDRLKIERNSSDETEDVTFEEEKFKTSIGQYHLFLVGDNSLLLQCLKRKIILVDFIKKRFSTLFVNTEAKRSIRLISVYDEFIVVKGKNDSTENITRTYVFCISNRKLFFFILNYKAIFNKQFIVHFFPIEEYSDSIEEFLIQRVDHREEGQKWYYLFVLLLEGKLVRYVTNWMNLSIKDVLLNFRNLLKNKTMKKCLNSFDKIPGCHVKIIHSLNGISFITLQMGNNDLLAFRYYNSDTPEELSKRFCMEESELIPPVPNINNINNFNTITITKTNNTTNHITINTTNNNNNAINTINNNNNAISPTNNNNAISPININNVINNSNNNANNNLINMSTFNTNTTNSALNTSININTSMNPIPDNFDNTQRTSHPYVNYNHNSQYLFQSVTPKIRNNPNAPQENVQNFKYIFITKEKDVIHYSTLNPLLNQNNQNSNHVIPNEENQKPPEKQQTLSNKFSSSLTYTFTSYHLCKICPISNALLIFSFPSSKEIEFLQGEIEYDYKFTDLKIYAIFHYEKLNYSFLLTSKFILKIRYFNRLHYLLDQSYDYRFQNDGDSFYKKMKKIVNYKSHPQSNRKCRVCQMKSNLIICDDCKQAYYCSYNHMDSDKRKIHFIECEMFQFISAYDKEKSNDKFYNVNHTAKMILRVLKKMFVYIYTENDYAEYIVFVQILVNIFTLINDTFLHNYNDLLKRNSIVEKICWRIYNMEIWFFFFNLNVLCLNFARRSQLFLLSSWNFQSLSLEYVFLRKIDNRNAYLKLNCDISNYIKDIESYSSDFFFNLISIYSNSNNILQIYEKFITYHLNAQASLLKIGIDLYKCTLSKKVQECILNKVLPNIPIVFEERNIGTESQSDQIPEGEKFLQVSLAYCYFFLSFVLVKLNRVSAATLLLNYILTIVQKINEESFSQKYYGFEARILVNCGILLAFNGSYARGIHKIEECYRLCFKEELPIRLLLKSQKLLILSYLNIHKFQSAYIIIRTSMQIRTKFIHFDNDDNSNEPSFVFYRNNNRLKHFSNYMKLMKLKAYILFIIEYLGFELNKSNQGNGSLKDKKLVIANKNKAISKDLVSYINSDSNSAKIKTAKLNRDDNECYKDKQKRTFIEGKKNKYKTFGKEPFKAAEFLYELSQEIFDQMNIDNASIRVENENEIKEDYHEKSISKEVSTLNASTMINKELNQVCREEEMNFIDDIEIKMPVYEKLTREQKDKLKHIDNKAFSRSILLRDPNGRIDRFNLNYHPIYSLKFSELIEKIEENQFLKKISGFPLLEGFEEYLFSSSKHSLLESLKEFFHIERVRSIFYMEKWKYKEKYYTIKKKEEKESKKKNLLSKIKEKLIEEGYEHLGFIDNALKGIYNEFSEKELEYIYNNPKCLLPYLYVDTKNKLEFINEKDLNANETIKEKDNDKYTESPRSYTSLNNNLNQSSNQNYQSNSSQEQEIYTGKNVYNMENDYKESFSHIGEGEGEREGECEIKEYKEERHRNSAKNLNKDDDDVPKIEDDEGIVNIVNLIDIKNSSKIGNVKERVKENANIKDTMLTKKNSKKGIIKRGSIMSFQPTNRQSNIAIEKKEQQLRMSYNKEKRLSKRGSRNVISDIKNFSIINEENSNSPFITEDFQNVLQKVSNIKTNKNNINLIKINGILKEKEKKVQITKKESGVKVNSKEKEKEENIEQDKKNGYLIKLKNNNYSSREKKKDIEPMEIIKALIDKDFKKGGDSNYERSTQTNNNTDDDSYDNYSLYENERKRNFKLKQKPSYETLRNLVFVKKINSQYK